MKQSMRLTFRKGDWLAIGLVLILAAAVAVVYFPKENTSEYSRVQIYREGTLVQELPLSTEEVTYTVSGDYTNQITIRGGKAAITESDCPGGDCVHSGWISDGARSIVCLPNRVEIRIAGSSEVDFVVR